MKVVHVITRLMAGGAQQNTVATAILQRQLGIDAELLVGRKDDSREGDLEALAIRHNVPLNRLDWLQREPRLGPDLAATVTMTRWLRRRRFDVVHTHTSKAGFIGRLAARLAGCPVVVHTPHGHVFHSYYGPLLTRLYVLMERTACSWSERLIALTPREVEEHLELGIGSPGNFLVVPSGIDIERFRSTPEARATARQHLGLNEATIAVGCIGRLTHVKGQDLLVATLPELLARHPIRLCLIGDGDTRTALQGLASELGVGAAIDFRGWQERPEKYLPAFDLLVVPSRNEGMGRVLLEGMAAGVAIVASDVGGIPDIIEDGRTGLLVAPDDVPALTRSIDEMASNPEQRTALATAAASRMRSEFNQQHMAERLVTLYRELRSIANHSSQPSRNDSTTEA